MNLNEKDIEWIFDYLILVGTEYELEYMKKYSLEILKHGLKIVTIEIFTLDCKILLIFKDLKLVFRKFEIDSKKDIFNDIFIEKELIEFNNLLKNDVKIILKKIYS